jgi:hypothetical protein
VEVQLVHAPPVPHAPSSVPKAHVPVLQHPPLHAVWFVPMHALPHMCAFMSHAWPAFPPLALAQSVCESQPHTSVPGSHFVPIGLFVQTAHAPEPPHAPAPVPATQVLPEQQKPPLHIPLPPPHVDTHAPAVHVGVPAAHGGKHACPLRPQAPFCVPVTQLPELQQPPLQPVSFVPRHPPPHVCVTVLHASPASEPVAAAQSVTTSHPQVSVPGSHLGPLGLPTQLVQTPDPPHAAGRFPLTHDPDEQQKPALQFPSPPDPQAAVHVPAAHVGVPALQVAHARPFAPHAPLPVPATQIPPVPQHPPLHGCVASHWLVQTCVATLHDSSGAQSLELLQPHEVPFSHTWPTPETVQSAHVLPPMPQALVAAPATHVEPEQQPPLHPVVLAPHVAEQMCVVVLQAWSAGQSVAALQPHVPVARHAWPVAPFVQFAQSVPVAPHTGWLVPV